jgi:hypothetical protein
LQIRRPLDEEGVVLCDIGDFGVDFEEIAAVVVVEVDFGGGLQIVMVDGFPKGLKFQDLLD